MFKNPITSELLENKKFLNLKKFPKGLWDIKPRKPLTTTHGQPHVGIQIKINSYVHVWT